MVSGEGGHSSKECVLSSERPGSSCGDRFSAVKDEVYWERRKRNNDAARRSREKRRLNDMVDFLV